MIFANPTRPRQEDPRVSLSKDGSGLARGDSKNRQLGGFLVK